MCYQGVIAGLPWVVERYGISRSRDYIHLHGRLLRRQTIDDLDLESESESRAQCWRALESPPRCESNVSGTQALFGCELHRSTGHVALAGRESIEVCSCKKCALREEVRNGDVH